MKISSLLLVAMGLHGGKIATAMPPSDSVREAISILAEADSRLSLASTLVATVTKIDQYPGEFRDLRQSAKIVLARPNEARVEIQRARRISSQDEWKDTGNNTLTVYGPSGQYSVFFHPQSVQVRKESHPTSPSLKDFPIVNGFFGGTSSPAKLIASAQSDGTLKDVAVNGSDVEFTIGATHRVITIGKDGLVHRVIQSNGNTHEEHTWILDSVALGSHLDQDAFRYSPPRDALPFDQYADRESLSPGDIAPSFSVVDSKGKTIRLADLRGKVVILKFWATWCWPCNQSLPETESVTASNSAQGVETVAVAIKDNKKGFDAWLAKHPQYSHIRFAFEDPLSPTVSTAYQVRTQPTEFVISKTGKIESVIEGFTGPSPALAEAVTKALAID